MNFDLLGNWQGTAYTDGLWFTPSLFNMNGEYEGGVGSGGPPQTYTASLEIKWQGDYQTFYYALVVRPFYGQLVGVQQDSIPVSGFLNTQGFIKLSFYVDSPALPPGVQSSLMDWNFNGHITTQGGFRNLSGNWTKTSWSDGILSYQRGTLNIKRAISLTERASMYLKALWSIFTAR